MRARPWVNTLSQTDQGRCTPQMELIYPLHEESIKRFCGMPVCVVTTEGARHVGILSSCQGGRVMLNERPGSGKQATAGTETSKSVAQKSKKSKKAKSTSEAKSHKSEKAAAQTQAYYPYDPYYGGYGYDNGYGYDYGYPYGEALGFDLASIAYLFLLF